MLAIAIGVGLVAIVTYLGAREFTRRAADTRASEEARSFAQHSSLLATGDAFNGYLQILRYADDNIVRSPTSMLDERRGALQQLLWLNTNRMQSLAIVDRNGKVLATTDRRITDVGESEALKTSRANQGPANSDIILPAEGRRGYVEFTAALRDDERRVWGFIYARADPQDLWRDTLYATIDGGRNVIINSAGAFATGVPDEMLGTPWRGVPLANGSVRAEIGTNEYICGLGGIGKETQIDYGWNVASCLPASLIQTEASAALGDQAKVTVAVAVLAVVVAAGFLRLTMNKTPAGVPATRPFVERVDGQEDDAAVESDPDATAEAAPQVGFAPEDDGETTDAEPDPAPAIVADVDALTLIDAYERRNGLLAERMRELIQARIMIASTQADEAYRLIETDQERSAAMHQHAIEALEELRERELRLMTQELHPSIVRLGLPSALRALAKDLAGAAKVELDIEPLVDGASSRGGRITIDPKLRLLLYRLIRDAIDARREADTPSIRVRIAREDSELSLDVTLESGGTFDERVLDAAKVSIEAYGGTLTVGDARVEARVHAPHVEQPESDVDAGQVDEWPAADAEEDPGLVTMDAPREPLPHDGATDGASVGEDVPGVSPIRSFTLPEGAAAVVKENEDSGDDERSLQVTTFVLEEDEIAVTEATPTDEVDRDADAPDSERNAGGVDAA